jgi:hypothetical protein
VVDRTPGAIGFALAAYPLTLLSTAAFGMRQALIDLQAGHTPEQILSSEEMKTLVGFDSYLEGAVKPESAPIAVAL